MFLKRSGSSYVPDRVAFAQHTRALAGILDDGGDTVYSSQLQTSSDGFRPVVYVGLGGHASYHDGQNVTNIIPLLYDESHFGLGSFLSPPAQYVPRVGERPTIDAGNPITLNDWLLFPGQWGRSDIGGLLAVGDSGPQGFVFQSLGFGAGKRWLDPWDWSDGFNRIGTQPLLLDEAMADDVESSLTSSDPVRFLPESLFPAAWDQIVIAALQQWQGVIEQENFEASLDDVRFEAVDLPGAMLALATPQTDGSFQISLDLDAANFGWYVDPTPQDNSEFEEVVSGGQLRALEQSAAARQIDLFTVVAHELGHVIGLPDLDERDYPTSLLTATLPPGVRRPPRPVIPSGTLRAPPHIRMTMTTRL